MNNETHEDRVKILEGAPKINIDNSVLHISSCGIYYKSIDGLNNGKNWEFWDSSRVGKVDRWDWVGDIYLTELGGLRSLSDLKTLVDMQNEIDEFKRCLRRIDAKLSYALYDEDGTLDNIRKSLLLIHEVSNE